MFEAYLTNTALYPLMGIEVGTVLKFPATTQEVQDALAKIGIDGKRYTEVFITSFDSDVLGLYDYTGSVKDLINLAQNLDLYRFYPDIDGDEALGLMYAEELHTIEIPEHIRNYFDYEAYGRDMRLNEGGVFAPGGYAAADPGTFREYYRGTADIPPEHRIFAYPEKARSVPSILDTLKQFQKSPPASHKEKTGISHEER